MTRQWIRDALVVVGKSGTGLSIQYPRISFEVTKTAQSAPNIGTIKLYNLLPVHEARIQQEYVDIFLYAGYGGVMRELFQGNVKHVYRYRDNGVDRVTEIEAGDGDADYRTAVVNVSISAGATPAQVVSTIAAALNSTEIGHVDIGGTPLLRGKVLSGSAKDLLDDFAKEQGAQWSIQGGRLQLVKMDAVLPGQAILVTASTGLLTSPEISSKGINFKCLLNPLLAVGGVVKLDNNTVKAQRESNKLGQSGRPPLVLNTPVALDPDGVYKLTGVTHRGDTRGNDWVSEGVCIGQTQNVVSASDAEDETEE